MQRAKVEEQEGEQDGLSFAGELLSKSLGNARETFYCKMLCRGRSNWCAGTRGAVITGSAVFWLALEPCVLNQTGIAGVSDPTSDRSRASALQAATFVSDFRQSGSKSKASKKLF